MLIDTDVRATARLVLLDFPLDLAEITYKLQANPAEQFNFLQGIFDPKFVWLHSTYACMWWEYYFVLCRSQTKQEIAPPSHVVERYIELLCRYQPQAVYNFLKLNDNYRLEEALDVS